MESHQATLLLKSGCKELCLPASTAKELIRFLLVKSMNENSTALSPSRKLDELQHWLLLNTDARKSVEKLVGEIHHTTSTAKLAEKEKGEHRLASMDAMSREGWDPRIELWQEENTLLHAILFIQTEAGVGNEIFKMYYSHGCGQEKILKSISNGNLKCSAAFVNLHGPNHDYMQADLANLHGQGHKRKLDQAAHGLEPDEKIIVRLEFPDKDPVTFVASYDATTSVLHRALKMLGQDPEKHRFLNPFSGSRLLHHELLRNYADGKEVHIHVLADQLGC